MIGDFTGIFDKAGNRICVGDTVVVSEFLDKNGNMSIGEVLRYTVSDKMTCIYFKCDYSYQDERHVRIEKGKSETKKMVVLKAWDK